MPLPAVAGLLSSAMGSGGGASALGGLGSAITGLGSACANAAGLASQLGKSLLGALTGPLDAVKSLGNAVGSFVEKINPAAVQAFERAIDNAMATIGTMLVPIMQALTDVAQQLGKAFASLQPVLAPLMNAIGGVISGFAQSLQPLAEALAPFLQILVDGFTELMKIWSRWQATVVGFVTELASQLADLLGLKNTAAKGADSDKAVGKHGISSVQDFAKLHFAAQIKGALSKPDAQAEALQTQKQIQAALAAGKSAAADLAAAIKSLVDWLRTAKSAGSAAKSVAGGAADGYAIGGIPGAAFGASSKLFDVFSIVK